MARGGVGGLIRTRRFGGAGGRASSCIGALVVAVAEHGHRHVERVVHAFGVGEVNAGSRPGQLLPHPVDAASELVAGYPADQEHVGVGR